MIYITGDCHGDFTGDVHENMTGEDLNDKYPVLEETAPEADVDAAE